MQDKIKLALHVFEGVAGYKAVKYVPNNKFLKQWNHVAVGVGVSALGLAVIKGEAGSHIFAVGLGATLEGVLTLVGMQ